MSLFFVHAVFAVTRRGVTSPSFASLGEKQRLNFEKNKNNSTTVRLVYYSRVVVCIIHTQKSDTRDSTTEHSTPSY